MTDTSGDYSPCRWARMFNDGGADSDRGLVDLTPCEQQSRGQELLRLLWEPVMPCAVGQSLPALEPQPPSSKMNLRVENTFIELVDSPCRRNINRSQSDPAIMGLSTENLASRSCADKTQCRSRHGVVDDHPHSSLADRQLQNRVVGPHTLDLHACLHDDQCWDGDDMFRERVLSDASTDTPDEPIEDSSLNDVCDASLFGDTLLESGAWHRDDASHSLRLGQGYFPAQKHSAFSFMPVDQACTSAQMPFTCPATSGDTWSYPWQWNTIAMPVGSSHCE